MPPIYGTGSHPLTSSWTSSKMHPLCWCPGDRKCVGDELGQRLGPCYDSPIRPRCRYFEMLITRCDLRSIDCSVEAVARELVSAQLRPDPG